MEGQPDLYSLLLELLRSTQLVLYFDVSAVALYVWDYFLTFGLELDLVWKSKWSWTTCLFLLQRYLPFLDVVGLIPYENFRSDISVTQCQRAYQVLGWMLVSGTFLSELLLALRVWAVWDRKKWLAVVLLLSVVGLWTPCFYYVHKFLISLGFGPRPYPGFVGCLLVEAPDVLFIPFVCIMIWNLGTLTFMLIPGLKAYQAGGNSALFYVVYRDGVTYYIYLVVLSVLNVVAIRTFPPGLHYVFLSMQRCLHSILSSRVLLHLRYHVKYGTEVSSQASNRFASDIHHYESGTTRSEFSQKN